MVQVDIFWSYGLSAGLALAAGPALKNKISFWNNKFITLTLLWTAIIFAPSGIYLLWEFPGWETMFVARNHLSIPTWLVCLFSITNITQGILGFYVTWYFLRKGVSGSLTAFCALRASTPFATSCWVNSSGRTSFAAKSTKAGAIFDCQTLTST